MSLSRRRAAAPPLPRRAAWLCLLAALLCAWPGNARAQQRYVNLVNKRFATVSSGPQSSLLVDVPAAADSAAVARAVGARVRAEWGARARALAPQVAQARRSGLLGARSVLPISTLVTVRQNGRLVLPERNTRQAGTRQVGGGTLTFSYTGFAPQDEQFLRQFQAQAYPLIENVYGRPAWSGNVEVVNMGPLEGGQFTQVRRLAFGAYDVSGGRILLPLYENVDTQAHAFLLLMVHAFHGPATFQYDAWEQGFARAAASIVARSMDFLDATANGLYSLLRFYDLLNQPTLGNSTFNLQKDVPIDISSGVFSAGKMFLPRLGMSGAAFLKLYIENPAFFQNFNAAYYAQFNPAAQPSLAGNVPALRGLAAGALRQGRPDDSVEGLPFAQWFERQYVLDTSVSPGEKLFAFVIPSDPDAENGQSSLIALVYFRTKSDGDEDLLAGRGYATYFDAANARLSLGPASEQTEIDAGEGFLTTLAFPTPGVDAGRYTMDFHAGNATARSYLPSGFGGDFQGVVLGGQGGTVAVRQTTLPPIRERAGTGPVENGGFGIDVGTGSNDLAVTVVDVTINNATTSYRFNTGDGRYYAVIRSGGVGDVRTVTHVYQAGLALVSFPVRPLQTDIGAALGLPVTDFLLSYWNPGSRVYDTFGQNSPAISRIDLGRGYWLKLFPPAGVPVSMVSLTGPAPPTDTDVTVSLPFGWNLVGTPFAGGTNVSDLFVQYLQNDAIPWDDAVARNLVAAQPFEYNTVVGAYAALPVDTGRLEAWRGYWLRVLVPTGVTLLYPAPDAPGRAVRTTGSRAAKAKRPNWSIRLRARADGGQSALAHLGVAPGASAAFDNRFDLEAPPPITPALALEFPHADWAGAAGRYVADYRGPDGGRAAWDLSVTAPAEGRVTLTWEGMGAVPRQTRLTLVDPATGTRTALRSRSSYTFTARAGESRALQIVAEPERSVPLAVTAVAIRQTRAVSGIAVEYAVTADADVTVEIGTLGGKRLRRLSGGRARAANKNTVVWDGRGDTGAPVPAGPYTITITARDEEGGLARQSRPVLMLR